MFYQELDFNSNTFRETPRKKGGLYFYTKRKIKNELKLFHPPPPPLTKKIYNMTLCSDRKS